MISPAKSSIQKVAAYIFALAVFAATACSEDTEYTTSILSRPVDLVVTCMSADRSFVDVADCNDTTGEVVSWILDADLGGLFVSTVPYGNHFDFDRAEPGYTPVPVGEHPVAVESSPDSRYVFAAVQGQGTPAIKFVDGDFYNLDGVDGTFGLECPVVDMTVVPGESFVAGYTIAALLDCDSGYQVWNLAPVSDDLSGTGDSFLAATMFAAVPGDARYLSFGEGLLMVVSSNLPDDEFDVWDHIIIYTGFLDGDVSYDAVAVVNDSALVPDMVVSGSGLDEPPGCAPTPAAPAVGYVSGRPAVSPGGNFIYVPIAVPAGIAVFDADFRRVDTHDIVDGLDTVSTEGTRPVNAEDWEIANLLARWQGYLDIRMDSPPAGVDFVQLEDGLRAVAWLYGGQIVRIVVDPIDDLPWPHRTENDLDYIESSAYMPVITWRGQDLERAVITRTDLPWFGSRSIVTPATEEDRYGYYGISFNGDIEAEAPETWSFVYEGVIPGAEGACGTLTDTSTGESSSWRLEVEGFIDFCALGIEAAGDSCAGDILQITMPVNDSCGAFSGRIVELRISGVTRNSMNLKPLSVGVDSDFSPDCLAEPVEWKVRASGQWIAVGTRSGFFHPWEAAVDDTCVHRQDADPIFNGRLKTAMPPTGIRNVDSCPISLGIDSIIDWESTRFTNPLFSLHLLPGCSIGEDFKPVIIPPERGTVLKFGVETGRIPYQYDVGGLATGMVVIGDTLYVLESSNGRLMELALSDMTVTGSWF